MIINIKKILLREKWSKKKKSNRKNVEYSSLDSRFKNNSSTENDVNDNIKMNQDVHS